MHDDNKDDATLHRVAATAAVAKQVMEAQGDVETICRNLIQEEIRKHRQNPMNITSMMKTCKFTFQLLFSFK